MLLVEHIRAKRMQPLIGIVSQLKRRIYHFNLLNLKIYFFSKDYSVLVEL